MFQNVGREIKAWAKFIVIVITILGAVLGFSMGQFGGFFAMLITGCIAGVIGYFLGRLSAMLLYAFGELVDSATQIEEILKTRRSILDESLPPAKKVPPVPKKEPWVCRDCGEQNTADAMFCVKCGSPK